jgi:hypothetical protein
MHSNPNPYHDPTLNPNPQLTLTLISLEDPVRFRVTFAGS